MEWLFAPIDPDRVHAVGTAVSWHARLMVLAWGFLAPIAVLVARFFKVVPGQDWPKTLDNQMWWRSHWVGQLIVVAATFIALFLVLPSDLSVMSLHGWTGYAVICGALAQITLGYFRGSKGGPGDLAKGGSLRGHHYDMTRRRLLFEWLHKTIGYGTVLTAVAVIILGLWKANGPVWMWLCLGVWWSFLVVAFLWFRSRGMAIDTYQAIWGPDEQHPGNLRPKPGWGMRRLDYPKEGGAHVRDD